MIDSHPLDVPRPIVFDIFKEDETEEAPNLAEFLGDRLEGIRLSARAEPEGIEEYLLSRDEGDSRSSRAWAYQYCRSRSDLIQRSSDSARRHWSNHFIWVGSVMSQTLLIGMTLNIKEVEGKPIAKRREKISGSIPNAKLEPIAGDRGAL